MKQLCKRILSSLLCLAMLLTLLPVGILAADASMIIHVSPSAADVQIGDVVEYTVTVQGSNIGAMQFDLVIPEGMTYVPNSASVPAGLSIAIGWLEADWTEATMRWTGFNDHSTDIAANTVILTFRCTVDDYGTYLVELRELLPYDKDYALMDASLTVDPVSAHDLADYVDNNDATCTQDGTKTGTCTQCGKTLSVPAPGSALGHALSQYISDGNATCIQDGTKTAACDRCGFTDTVTDEGSALGHGYTALKTEPTCTEGGYTTYTCTRCGDSYVADQVDATGHRYYKGVCTVCGLRNDSVFLDVKIVAEQFGCEEVRYTVYGHGAGITGMQFVPMIPEGMTYVANSAVIPAGLSNDLGWGSIDWNERYQRWSGYTDLPSDIPEGTALLTFVCRIDVPGTYEIGMDELLPFDEDYAEFGASLTVDAVSGHELGEFVYNNDETCTQDGTESAICSKCSDTVTRTVANTALGHAYGDYASNNDTTCTEDGTKTATCDRCGATDTVTDEGSALGHAFTQYFPDGNATCTGDGTKTATCDRCDATDTVADEGSTLGHAFTQYLPDGNATCTGDGTKTATCDRCDATDTVTDEGSALGHAFTQYLSDGNATCIGDGTKTATCDRCGATDTVADEGSALGHAFTQYLPDGNATCTGDGTKTATCDRCDATDTVADEGSALGHAYVAEKTEPTCTEHGFTTYTCTLCGATEKVIDEGSALGHAYAEEKTEPTCTEDGFTTYTCTLCGATEKVIDEGSALGHAYAAEKTEPTCTEDGFTTYTCTLCGATDIVIDEGSALGHAYTAVKTEPTCTEQGFTTYTCTACGDSYVDDYVDAAGHLYEEGSCTVCGQPEDTTYMDVKIVAEQSGCEEVRYTVYGHASGITAVKFALKIPEGMTYVPNSAEIPADLQENLGWDNVNWNEHYLRWAGYTELPSEIAEDTVLLTFVCQIEAPGTYEIGLKTLTPYDENLEEFEASLTVDTVSGHEMGEFIYNNDATCTQDGTETAACTKCRYAVTQTTENSALGHVFDEYVSNHDATCTEDGTATATCGRCGETDTVADEGSAYGHSYEAVVTEATCETGGYTTYTCTVCGDEYVDDRVEALGHSYSGAVEEEPTVEKAGVLAVTCSGCGDVIREVLPTLTEQDYVFGIQSLPTCTADGALSYTWNNTAYGTYSFYVILPSRGHSFKDGACTICGTPDPDVAPTVVIPTLTLKAPSLEFKDTVRVNAFFTAENTDDVVEMGMITYSSKVDVWNVETAEHVIPGTTYDANTGRYMAVSQGIHAKYLCDTVYLAIYAKLSDGTYVYSKLAPYSPVQYAASQLKNSTDMKLKQLVVAMLNYGAEAQLFFGYNTGNLANASLTDEQKVLPEAYRSDMVGTVPGASAEKQGEFANNGGFSKRYPAISFEGALGINYFFTPNYVPVDGVTLYYWNEADFGAAEVLTAENATGSLKMEGTGEYRGDIQNISAKELSEAVYVAAVYSDGTTTWTSGVLGYSIGSYCSSQSAKGTTVASLAEATAVYGYHAKQYFG